MSAEYRGYQGFVNHPVGQDVAAYAEVQVLGPDAYVCADDVRERVPEYGQVMLTDGRMVSDTLVRSAAFLKQLVRA